MSVKKLYLIPVLLCAILLPSASAYATTTDISSPTSGATLTSKPATFSGNTIANGPIDLNEDGTTIASTQADVNGDWTITTSNIKSGAHNYTASYSEPDLNIAYMNGQATGTIETVDVNNHEFLDTIVLPPSSSSYDLVVRNSTLYVPIAEDEQSAMSIHCSIAEYELPQNTLTRQISLGGDCNKGEIDVNAAGTMAVVLYQTYDFGTYRIAAVDLVDNTIIDDIDTGYGVVGGIVFGADGQSFFIRPDGAVAKYHVVNGAIELVESEGYNFEFSQTIDVSPTTGQIAIAEPDNGDVRLVNPDDLTDTTVIHVADDVAQLSRLAFSHDGTKLMVVGANTDTGPQVWEINTSTGLVGNEYDLTEYPESVGYTPDDSQYVIGDNFGSGTIFFGAPGGSNFTDTITQSNRSYAMRNSNFIASYSNSDTSVAVSITNTFPVSSYGTDANGNITTKTVAPGGDVQVSGSGFLPDSDVTITLNSTPVLLKTVKTNSSGSFSTTVTIPTNTALGSHTLVVSGKDANGNTVSSVLSLNVAVLPATGNNASSAAILGLSLLLLGSGLLLVCRRKVPSS